MITTFRLLFAKAMAERGETFDDIEAMTLPASKLDEEFDNHFGGLYDINSFTIWTAQSVYFSLEYDGKILIDSVSRHPDNRPPARRSMDDA